MVISLPNGDSGVSRSCSHPSVLLYIFNIIFSLKQLEIMNQSIINAIREAYMESNKIQHENQRLVKENQKLKDEKNELIIEISEVMNAFIKLQSELEKFN